MVVEFIVPGPAIGKQRPRFRRIKNFVTTYTPKKTMDYQDDIKTAYKKVSNGKLLEGSIKAEVCAIYEPPKSTSKKKKLQMLTGEIPYMHKPDCDNIAKAALDALNEVAYKDDSAIDDLRVTKMYGEEACLLVRLSDNKHVISPFINLKED